jgi:hypothetical protein
MTLRASTLLLCSLGIQALAQEPPPAPVPAPLPQVAPAPAPPAEPRSEDAAALKAALEALQTRVRQQGEDELLRSAELKRALADLQKQLAALEALPLQMKVVEDQAKAADERLAAADKARLQQVQARLDGEAKALLAALQRLGILHKELQGFGPLGALEKALGQFQEATSLANQPAFQAVIGVVKDKLLKGPLGNPLKDPATQNNYFGNPTLGASWTVAAVLLGPGWGDGDKLKNLEKGFGAVDVASRMDGDLKAAQALVAALKGEVALQLAAAEETQQRAKALLDPAAAALEAEVLAAKVEAAFKPLVAALAQGGLEAGSRDALVELLAVRAEARFRLWEHRLLLDRLVAGAAGLGEQFGRYRKDAPGRDLPALETLLKGIDEARGRCKALAAILPAEGREFAQLEAAGYPLR